MRLVCQKITIPFFGGEQFKRIGVVFLFEIQVLEKTKGKNRKCGIAFEYGYSLRFNTKVNDAVFDGNKIKLGWFFCFKAIEVGCYVVFKIKFYVDFPAILKTKAANTSFENKIELPAHLPFFQQHFSLIYVSFMQHISEAHEIYLGQLCK